LKVRYQSGGAFRRALETRLRDQSLSSGLPLVRLRKMVAFDRLLARLTQSDPGQWIVKGGLALQLRLGARARTTKDIDLLSLKEPDEVHDLLREAAARDLGDWFTFEVGRPSSEPGGTAIGGIRYAVLSLLDGRTFERFHVDVGVGDLLVDSAEYLIMPDLLSFAEIDPIAVPCYPITQQLAEKLHAYSRPYVSGASSRMKDFIDILLLAEMGEMSGRMLTMAIEATFRGRGDRDIPRLLPPPRAWEGGFKRLATEVGLPEHDLQSSYVRIRQFFDPILTGEAGTLRWNPDNWSWK